ncbi:hypothetical protein C8Q76DRAFT_789167 [Earliella scabrosa]|nr:hypothetical protein C8Q76DRAFT_789167 [Earliella scabrosa]
MPLSPRAVRDPEGHAHRLKEITRALEAVRAECTHVRPASPAPPPPSTSSTGSSAAHCVAPASPHLGDVSSDNEHIGGSDIPVNMEHFDKPDPQYRGKWYIVTMGLKVRVWKNYASIRPFVKGVSGAMHQSA